MIAPTLNLQNVMEQFDVFYDANHGGTFNGCLETLHMSLEQFIKNRTIDCITNVVLDHRTPLGRCFSYLRGGREQFIIKLPGGKEDRKFVERPTIFRKNAEDLLYVLISNRNDHIHLESNYPLFYEFQNISFPVGDQFCLIFNPATEVKSPKMIFDDECNADVSKFQIIIQNLNRTRFKPDMSVCNQYYADLILEVLTKSEFNEENPGEPDMGTHTHALVIYYGTKKFFVYIRRAAYSKLKSCFNDTNNNTTQRWKTHYFRFSAQCLLTRMIL